MVNFKNKEEAIEFIKTMNFSKDALFGKYEDRVAYWVFEGDADEYGVDGFMCDFTIAYTKHCGGIEIEHNNKREVKPNCSWDWEKISLIEAQKRTLLLGFEHGN